MEGQRGVEINRMKLNDEVHTTVSVCRGTAGLESGAFAATRWTGNCLILVKQPMKYNLQVASIIMNRNRVHLRVEKL
jgi:hypothetical protein